MAAPAATLATVGAAARAATLAWLDARLSEGRQVVYAAMGSEPELSGPQVRDASVTGPQVRGGGRDRGRGGARARWLPACSPCGRCFSIRRSCRV